MGGKAMAYRGAKHKGIRSCILAQLKQHLQNKLAYNQLTILYKFDLGKMVFNTYNYIQFAL